MKTLTILLFTLVLTGCAVDQNAWYMSPQPARCPQPETTQKCRLVPKIDAAGRYIGDQRICDYR